jgi:hypothetical protein
MPQTQEVRACMLQVIADQAPTRPGEGNLQSVSVLEETRKRLGGGRDHSLEEAILTVFHDLFRTGYLAWGFNLLNPSPPFFHMTEQGRRSLATLSRDPSNPDGYLNFLSKTATLNPIADSYLREALACFVHDLPKAAAVMVGGASESMALELRDAIAGRLQSLSRPLPKGIDDWRFKVVLDSIYSFLDQNTGRMSRELRDSFRSYWPAFLQQIRSARNDAGHPSSVDPVTFDTVHASLLIFPELAKLTGQLLHWVSHDYK